MITRHMDITSRSDRSAKKFFALTESSISRQQKSRSTTLSPILTSYFALLAAHKTGRLVKPRKDGKTVFYSLADDHVRTLIAQGMEHINE